MHIFPWTVTLVQHICNELSFFIATYFHNRDQLPKLLNLIKLGGTDNYWVSCSRMFGRVIGAVITSLTAVEVVELDHDETTGWSFPGLPAKMSKCNWWGNVRHAILTLAIFVCAIIPYSSFRLKNHQPVSLPGIDILCPISFCWH